MNDHNPSLQSLWMVVASLFFAAMGVCVKLAAQRHSAAEIVFYRSVISLTIMVFVVRWHGVSFRTPHWRLQLFRGATGFVSLLLYFYAIALLPLATAVTLNYTSPLFLMLYLAGFGGMKLARDMVFVLMIGFAAVVWLLQPTLTEDLWLGGLFGLASGMLAGLAYFNVRALGAVGEPETRTVFYFALLSAVGGAFWMVFFEFTALDLQHAFLMLGVGVFATFAQLAMTRSYRRGNAMASANLAYTAVMFASFFGVLFFGETLSTQALLAIGLIAVSGVAATRMSRVRPALVNPAARD